MKFTDLTENQQKVLRKLHDNALLNALNVNKKIAWYQFTGHDIGSCKTLRRYKLIECEYFTPNSQQVYFYADKTNILLARLTAKGIKCVEEA